MKVCKVIVTALIERNRPGGNGWPVHRQEYSKDNILEMLEIATKLDIKYKPGVPMDTYIVNNDLGDKEYNLKLDLLQSKKVQIITRPNNGGSFAAYMETFQNTKPKYTHYIFTEDDIIVGGKRGYVKTLISEYEKIKCSYLGLVGLGDERKPHIHGGVGLVSRYALEKTYGDTNPFLYPGFDRRKSIQHEIEFSSKIAEDTGLHLERYGVNDWDFDKNLSIDYYNLKNKYAAILENI